jgi:hypothetical protein
MGDPRLGDAGAAAAARLQRHPLSGQRRCLQGARAHDEPRWRPGGGTARLRHPRRRHHPVQRLDQRRDRSGGHAAAARSVAGPGRHPGARQHPVRRERPARRGARRDDGGGERAALDRARQHGGLQGRLDGRRPVGFLRAGRLADQLRGVGAALSLRGARAQADLEERDGGAAGGALHRRHPGHVAPVRLPGHAIGRRSGIIPPRIGFNQIFRQSPFLRRTIDDIGYYFALNDYVDAQVSTDWRSDARSTAFDPGYLKFNGQLNYRWRDRFISGSLASSYHYLRNGQSNTQYSLNHQQEFSQRTRLNATFNYVTNTTIQRNISFNPQQATQTIRSSLNYSTGRGPVSLNLGGSQVQYPGRGQLDRDFPSLGITTKPIRIGRTSPGRPGSTSPTRRASTSTRWATSRIAIRATRCPTRWTACACAATRAARRSASRRRSSSTASTGATRSGSATSSTTFPSAGSSSPTSPTRRRRSNGSSRATS